MLECFESRFIGAPDGAENNYFGFVCFGLLVWLKIAKKTRKIVGGCFVILSPGLWCFCFIFLGSEGWFLVFKNVGFTNVDSSAYGVNSRTVCGVLTP